MFLFCLVFAMFCARLFICALWSPAGKGLASWLSFVVSSVSLLLSHWYPGSGVVLDCIDSWSLHHYLLLMIMCVNYDTCYFYLYFPDIFTNNSELDMLWMVSQDSADKGYMCKLWYFLFFLDIFRNFNEWRRVRYTMDSLEGSGSVVECFRLRDQALPGSLRCVLEQEH